MRKLISSIIISLFLSVSVLAAESQAHDKVATISLKKPPEILAKWYKPENKRQVWLHTMFRLRREILAMNDYAQHEQQADLQRWSEKFIKDYQSIADMVPQWQKYLYPEKLKTLENAVKKGNYSEIAPILKKISKSCMHCHDDYQTVTTLLFRTPDFNERTISDSFSGENINYDDMMQQLSDSVNRINIAIKDGYFTQAKQKIAPLQQQLEHLSSGCGDCHKDDDIPVVRIMSAAHTLLPELEAMLDAKEQKQAGGKLGEFAVKVCAKCHSIHRLASDMKFLFE